MAIRTACVLGASGFVGRAACARLAGDGVDLRVLTRTRARANPLLVLPSIDVRVANPQDEDSLTRVFEGMDAVVNLVGILHEGGGATFEAVHAELPRKVANACRAAGVRRLVHMSALGASETAPSAYLRSKARGEAAARNGGDGLEVVMLRPSVVFGEEDRSLNLFARLHAYFPAIPLAAAEAKLQPVWVEDVARALSHAVRHGPAGKAYALCGPHVYSLRDLVATMGRLAGRERPVLALPHWAGALQAAVLGHLPGKLITSDNLRSLSVPNTCEGPWPAELGFQPAALEVVAPTYLGTAGPRGRYSAFRYRAGRQP